MKKVLFVILFCFLFLSCFADWDPGDPAKWVQLPDSTSDGVSVNFTVPYELADDFECTFTGLIEDIHIWCSWAGDYSPDVLGLNWNN